MCRRRAHARLAWEGAAKTGGAEAPAPRTGRVAKARIANRRSSRRTKGGVCPTALSCSVPKREKRDEA